MDNKTKEITKAYDAAHQLNRIADALEEILRLVKQDMEGSQKIKMSRRIDNPVVLINHWRWLAANGYKKEATSCKQQAASLTRQQYRIIKDICKQKKHGK